MCVKITRTGPVMSLATTLQMLFSVLGSSTSFVTQSASSAQLSIRISGLPRVIAVCLNQSLTSLWLQTESISHTHFQYNLHLEGDGNGDWQAAMIKDKRRRNPVYG